MTACADEGATVPLHARALRAMAIEQAKQSRKWHWAVHFAPTALRTITYHAASAKQATRMVKNIKGGPPGSRHGQRATSYQAAQRLGHRLQITGPEQVPWQDGEPRERQGDW